MNIQQALAELLEGHDLNTDQMQEVMTAIMTGACTPAQIAGFLVALRLKGETVTEIAAATEVMRSLSAKVHIPDQTHLIDTCGTGGDGANTFNISTCSAIVTAAAGATVAKHGNRSVSSNSGSADLLEACGMKLDLQPEQITECIAETSIGFMFAPVHHSAMKYAIGPRKELAIRTVFNLLGPLTNPASAPHQVIGVFARQWQKPMAQVLQQLGSKHVMVVHSDDGLDEISIAAKTYVVELKNNQIDNYTISPEDFGFDLNPLDSIAVDGPSQSLETFRKVLDNTKGPARDIVCLNAGAAIYTAGLCQDLATGIQCADETLSSGKAKNKLQELIACTQRLGS